MATLTSVVHRAAPEAVSNAPVEIWQEIINHTLFDPVIFSTDPFYPGCNYHTALNEWHNIRRLRDHEVRRGLLRLVSRSWKILADCSPWQFFEPLCYEEQRRSQAQYARRLEMRHSHHPCNDVWAGGDENCTSCYGYRESHEHYITGMLFSISSPPMKAEILRLPLWRDTRVGGIESRRHGYDSLHDLRTLFVGIIDTPTSTFADALANITVLGLRVLYQSTWESLDALPYVFPSIKTFQIMVADGCRHNCYNFITRWEMPRLVHLDATVADEVIDWGESLYQFIQTNGMHLASLRLRCLHDAIQLPDNLWSMLPLLSYFGASTIDTPYQGPPPNHPLRTFAILEDNKNAFVARDDVCFHILKSNNITTVADSHDWSDMPDEFSHLDGLEGDVPDPYHYHQDRAQFCWMCVVPLYMACAKRGLRYEDRNGRAFGEFQAQ